MWVREGVGERDCGWERVNIINIWWVREIVRVRKMVRAIKIVWIREMVTVIKSCAIKTKSKVSDRRQGNKAEGRLTLGRGAKQPFSAAHHGASLYFLYILLFSYY